MKVRIILICTLLLLAAVPSFALPVCKDCDENLQCVAIPGVSLERCFSSPGFCDTSPDPCSRPREDTTVLSDWQVESIEISCPAPDSVTAAAPAPAAVVPTPTSKTTELK